MTHFGPMSVVFEASADQITVRLDAPRRNPPTQIKLRLRAPAGMAVGAVSVAGVDWTEYEGDWVLLPGDIGEAIITASLVAVGAHP